MDNQKDDRLTIRVNTTLKQQATAKSKRTGITITHIVTQALEQWIAKPDPA